MAEMVLSKRSALMWAAKKAVEKDPYNWDDDLSWFLGNEERYRGIGQTQIDAVMDAARSGELSVDPKNVGDNGQTNWSAVLDDIHHGCMSEFIETPYGVLFMDHG
ncbi:hypothetical protein ACFZCP_14385 [Streptomyces sp. NPDC007971]|uniref:hypothetical protein n=1 Tax=Streptomyces sp. NPDC007971 TaxID=3364799 RepID=UPI0036E9449E